MKKSDIIEQTKTNAIILENTLKNIVQSGHKLRMSASSWRSLTDAQREGLANRRCDDDWAKAKVAFLDHQKDLGFAWVITQGHGGPAVLENISPPPDFGTALAAVAYRTKKKEGILDELLDQVCPNLLALAAIHPLDLKDLREGFKQTEFDNCSYRFAPGGSARYTLTSKVYKYGKSAGRKQELQLGEKIFNRHKTYFEFDNLDHCQTQRNGGRFENADFLGLKIIRGVTEDQPELISFELKATNDIGAVSHAISQAVNYRSRSNQTYIIIPLFDANSFHDNERLAELLSMCRSNGIGALSVSIDARSNEVTDLVEVQAAPYSAIRDNQWVKRRLQSAEFVPCPLCRRIVNQEDRAHCGWSIGENKDDVVCMKIKLESSLTGNGTGTSQTEVDAV